MNRWNTLKLAATKNENMKYDNNLIKEKYKNGEKLDFVFFWGHQSKNKNQIGKACLSQWFEREFEYQQIKYPTAEHWMMAEKAKLFNDNKSLERIVNCKSPKEAKAIGRKVKGFNDLTWLPQRERIVKKWELFEI